MAHGFIKITFNSDQMISFQKMITLLWDLSDVLLQSLGCHFVVLRATPLDSYFKLFINLLCNMSIVTFQAGWTCIELLQHHLTQTNSADQLRSRIVTNAMFTEQTFASKRFSTLHTQKRNPIIQQFLVQKIMCNLLVSVTHTSRSSL